ncbi:UNVERIFIED_CONTAM: hypothetical protein FKN15_046836 [Acipenser sinensis]
MFWCVYHILTRYHFLTLHQLYSPDHRFYPDLKLIYKLKEHSNSIPIPKEKKIVPEKLKKACK